MRFRPSDSLGYGLEMQRESTRDDGREVQRIRVCVRVIAVYTVGIEEIPAFANQVSWDETKLAKNSHESRRSDAESEAVAVFKLGETLGTVPFGKDRIRDRVSLELPPRPRNP